MTATPKTAREELWSAIADEIIDAHNGNITEAVGKATNAILALVGEAAVKSAKDASMHSGSSDAATRAIAALRKLFGVTND